MTWEVLKRPLVILGLILLTLGVLTFFWTRNHRALTSARREAEAAKLALSHQIVADEETAGQLRESVAGLISKNALLAAALEDAKAAAPGAQVVGSASLRTGVVEVGGELPEITRPDPPSPIEPAPDPGPETDRPPPLPECRSGLWAPDGAGGFYCKDANKDSPPAKKATCRWVKIPNGQYRPEGQCSLTVDAKSDTCLLSHGDMGSFRVDEVLLKTEQGNSLLTGTAEFWRESPTPRSKLAAGKFSSVLSDVDALKPPPEDPRWGASLDGLCSASGCGLGASLLLPPVRLPLVGWRAEGRVGALLGPVLAAHAGLGVRW